MCPWEWNACDFPEWATEIEMGFRVARTAAINPLKLGVGLSVEQLSRFEIHQELCSPLGTGSIDPRI